MSFRARVKTWRRQLFEMFGSSRYSRFALNDLDRKLEKYLTFRDGIFIEAGANDGLTQSNTYWFERFRGWRGLLVEAVPAKAQACRRNRSRARVVNSALVGSNAVTSVRMKTADLMAFVAGGTGTPEEEARHLRSAIEVQKLKTVEEIEVPAQRLSRILDAQGMTRVDLFSLDVEGYEIEVLKGLDLDRHLPTFILVETKNLSGVLEALKHRYRRIDQFSHHDYLLRAITEDETI
jgi:FkbM family methyltransferase